MDKYEQLLNTLSQKLGWAAPSQSGGGVWISSICPICDRRKLSINAVKGIYRCWRGCQGDGWSPLSDILDKGDIVLADGNGGGELVLERPEYISPGSVTTLSSISTESDAIKYLNNRGCDLSELENIFGVEYCVHGRKFASNRYDTTGTLIFPIYMNREIYGWQSRLLYDPSRMSNEECLERGMVMDRGKVTRYPKYFTMPGLRKGLMLYNYDTAIKSEVVVITEGVFDVFPVGRCAVASFGKTLTQYQIDLLTRWKVVVNLLDNDADGEADRLSNILNSRGIVVVRPSLPSNKDPGDCTREELWFKINKEFCKANLRLFDYSIVL